MSAPVTVLKHDPDSGCWGCPLHAHEGHREWCNAPSTDDIDDGREPAPDTCDLRSGPVEVRRG